VDRMLDVHVLDAHRVDGREEYDDDLKRAGRDNIILTPEDIESFQRQGIAIDDDNQPAPENAVPDAEPPEAAIWKEDSIICPRLANNCPDHGASFRTHSLEEVGRMSKLDLFLMMFPVGFLVDTVIVKANEVLDKPMDLSEMVRWIGCWFYMGCWNGIQNRKQWWSVKERDMFQGAPFRLHDYMSRRRFDQILAALSYTDRPSPDYEDGFYPMRQMEEEWNDNMTSVFLPSWVSVLDESMMEWFNKWAPGFMCVGRKPHPFGNERHTICCGQTNIMFRAQIVEGKDRPVMLGPKKWNEKGTTVGLMLRMTEPLHGSGKCVVMDSGFCVAQGIAELKKKGVYGAALIKKRRYWPKGVPGDAIDDHFQDKEVGDCAMLEAKTHAGDPFRIFCMKEPDYVMKIMSSWMTLDVEGKGEYETMRQFKNPHTGETVTKIFSYRQPFAMHYG